VAVLREIRQCRKTVIEWEAAAALGSMRRTSTVFGVETTKRGCSWWWFCETRGPWVGVVQGGDKRGTR